MPGLQNDCETEAAGRATDLLQRGIGDSDARPAVDEEELAFECCKARRLLGQNRPEHRPYAELLGAVAFQLGLYDGAFDHLDPYPAVGNVLRRHDGPAQMEPLGAVEIADRAGDRGEIRLRDLLAEIGLIDRGDPILGYGVCAADVDAAQHELRFGIAAGVGLSDTRKPDRRLAQRFPLGLVIEIFLGLARIETRLVRLLCERLGNSRKDRYHHHQRGNEMPLLNARRESLSVV
ncbi:hypothetical protein ABH979_005818 [Bradyrhizobium ottawaense]